ncbi:MAG: hypothetical protein WAK96_07915 [Desulfobaccales bacterium]
MKGQLSPTVLETKKSEAWKTPEKPALLFLLLLAVLSLPQNPVLFDLDVCWLIRDGQYILQNGHLPTGDLYSFTNLGHPWILYKWGFELYLGVLYHVASLGGVVWGTAIIFALTYSILLYILLRSGVPRLISTGLVILVLYTNYFHCFARPTIVTYLLYTVALLLLEDYRLSPGRQFWLLPPLFLLWANLHLGFIVALGALGLYSVTAWLLPTFFRGPGSSRDLKLLWILPLCAAAVLINPYGIDLLVKIWHESSSHLVTSGLTVEMESPNFHNPFCFPLLALIILLVSMRGRDYPGRPLLLTIVGVTLCLGLYSVRHIPYFSITATFHLAQALGKTKSSEDFSAAPLTRGWGWALMGAILSLIFVVGIAYLNPSFYKFPDSRVPRQAADYLARQCSGPQPIRIFSADDQWADYFIYRLYPRALVFFDTRFDLYGDDFLKKTRSLLDEIPYNLDVLSPWKVDFLVLNKRKIPRRPTLKPGWELVYEDKESLIYRPLAKKKDASSREERNQIL